MSYVIVCDDCERIFPTDGKVRKIYLDDPDKYSAIPAEHIIHLCDDCYMRFIEKYKPNLLDGVISND